MRVDEQNDERDTELDELRARLRETERELEGARYTLGVNLDLAVKRTAERDAATQRAEEAEKNARDSFEESEHYRKHMNAALARAESAEARLAEERRDRDETIAREVNEFWGSSACCVDREAMLKHARARVQELEANALAGLRELSCVSRELGEMQARAEAAEARWQEAWDIQAREAALSAAQARAESAEAKLKKCMGEAFEVAEELVETRAALRVAREGVMGIKAREQILLHALGLIERPAKELHSWATQEQFYPPGAQHIRDWVLVRVNAVLDAARAALAPKEGTP